MPDAPSSSETETTPKNAPRKKARGLIVVIVLVLAGAIALGWWSAQPSTSSSEGAAEPTLTLETFVVNLTGSSERAYLRVGITLGLAHPLPHRNPAAPMALVRDIILSVLGTARPEQLLQAEGKQRLKEELLKALQDRVPQLAVINVYFTEFLVQM